MPTDISMISVITQLDNDILGTNSTIISQVDLSAVLTSDKIYIIQNWSDDGPQEQNVKDNFSYFFSELYQQKKYMITYLFDFFYTANYRPLFCLCLKPIPYI